MLAELHAETARQGGYDDGSGPEPAVGLEPGTEPHGRLSSAAARAGRRQHLQEDPDVVIRGDRVL
jgi:hypothetical protein